MFFFSNIIQYVFVRELSLHLQFDNNNQNKIVQIPTFRNLLITDIYSQTHFEINSVVYLKSILLLIVHANIEFSRKGLVVPSRFSGLFI